MTTTLYMFFNFPSRNRGINKPFCQIPGRGEDRAAVPASRSAAVFGTRCPAGVFCTTSCLASSNLHVQVGTPFSRTSFGLVNLGEVLINLSTSITENDRETFAALSNR